jgi:hypothetical protein
MNDTGHFYGPPTRSAARSPWPTGMRRLAGEVRDIQFTFYHH